MSNTLKFRDLDPTEIAQHLKNLKVYGYTLIPDALSAGTVADLKTRTDQLWDSIKDHNIVGQPERDVDDKVIYNLQNKDKRFIDLLGYGALRAICIEMLNDPYYRFLPQEKPNYILNYFNARSSGQPLDLHIDSRTPAPGDRTWLVQAAFMLDDMNEENGCTVVVPGSHHSGTYTDREFKNVKPIVAKAGDLVFWDSRTWHGTLANTTKESRWAIIATMSSWWVKQSMDMTRSLPEEIYRQLTDEQKALLGFCSIPASSEYHSINTKAGYEALKPSVTDYYSRRGS